MSEGRCAFDCLPMELNADNPITNIRKATTAFLIFFAAVPLAGLPVQTQAAVVAPAETMVLGVILNTEDKGQLFVARTADGDFLVRSVDLKAIGFKEPNAPVVEHDGEPHTSLRSLEGLTFTFKPRTLVLDITADPRLLVLQTLEAPVRQRERVNIPTYNSAFFNYGFHYTAGNALAGSELGFAGEFGARVGNYLLLSNANTVQASDGSRKLVRLMSSLTHDNRDTLQRFVAGDFFASSRELGNGVLLGGVSLTKLYQLNPYLIQYPRQSITGRTALPSDLEVYIDGQQVRSEKLKPGEFELRDLLSYGGSRSVRILLRDPFGRVQEIDYSLYFSAQPLQQGLHEYSYNIGALRREYGTASNHYGPGAFSVFHRYGLTDAITLGFRAEGTHGMFNAGPGATIVLGSAGVVNLSLATSRINGQPGSAGLVDYNYQSKDWSLSTSLRRDSRNYAVLNDPPSITNRKYDGSVSAAYYLQRLGSVALSHSVLRTYSDQAAATATAVKPFNVVGLKNRRATTLSYSVPLISGQVSLAASLSHIKDQDSRNEIFVGLNFFLDKNRSASTSYRRFQGSQTESAQFSQNQPVGEGLGYIVSADRIHGPDDSSLQLRSSMQLNAPAAVLRGEYNQTNSSAASSQRYRLSVAGGLAYVGGQLEYGRPVTDSFGIVNVGKLEGAQVSVNGQDIGKTDAHGRLFIPNLTSYYENQVSILPQTIPIEYSIGSTVKRVSPSLRSGTVIDFGVTKLQAFTGIIKGVRQGQSKPLEFFEIALTVEGKPVKLPTGRGGEFYVEHLKPGTYPASVQVEDRPCQFDLKIPESKETFVELGEFVCRPSP